ncbi:HMG1/2-like protein [Papaver somniferum]|nr:HMG1/2-like protein [Papaver somniferum]
MKEAKSKTSTTNKSDVKLAVKRKAPASERAGKKPAKKEKPAKDPNKPKKPASAFFVFMEEFRQTFKKEHPNNKSITAVGKAGGDKWKSLSDAEKAPYVAKAEKRKTEYDIVMKAYNKKQAEEAAEAEDESDKPKSEVDDEQDESGGDE